jgi:2-hydroxychromene-2-carboxylate isomerase
VPFAQAAFRQAFAGGRSLADQNAVLIAAAACEMHPAAVLRGAELRSVAEQLDAATETAARLCVREVPAVAVGGRIFHGERRLREAGDAMREQAGEGRDGAQPVPQG